MKALIRSFFYFPADARIKPNRTSVAASAKSVSLYVPPNSLPFLNKGCRSAIVAAKPTRQPVVCMAYRYAPDSTLRKKKARKRGGDPRKKRKAKRKSKRSKKSTRVIFLVSSAKTGFSYAKRKGVESRDKLKFRKFDPVVNQHVMFQE